MFNTNTPKEICVARVEMSHCLCVLFQKGQLDIEVPQSRSEKVHTLRRETILGPVS